MSTPATAAAKPKVVTASISERIVSDRSLHDRYKDRASALQSLQQAQALRNALGGHAGAATFCRREQSIENASSALVDPSLVVRRHADGAPQAVFDLQSRRAQTSLPWYGHGVGSSSSSSSNDFPFNSVDADAAANRVSPDDAGAQHWGLVFYQDPAALAGIKSTALRGQVRTGFRGAEKGAGWDYVDRPVDESLTRRERRYADEHPQRWAKAVADGADLPVADVLSPAARSVASCHACQPSASEAVRELYKPADRCPSSEAGGCASGYRHPVAKAVSSVGSLEHSGCAGVRSVLLGHAYDSAAMQRGGNGADDALEGHASLREAGATSGRLRADVQRIYSERPLQLHGDVRRGSPLNGLLPSRASSSSSSSSGVKQWANETARRRYDELVSELGTPDRVTNVPGGEAVWDTQRSTTMRGLYHRVALRDVADDDRSLTVVVDRVVFASPRGAAAVQALQLPVVYNAQVRQLSAQAATLRDVVPLLLVALDAATDATLTVEQSRRALPRLRTDARDDEQYAEMRNELMQHLRANRAAQHRSAAASSGGASAVVAMRGFSLDA